MRFVIIVSCVIAVLWYGVYHDWDKNHIFLVYFAIVIPVIFLWYLLERMAWNHDLRRKRISTDSEVWGLTQFPEK